VIDTTDGGSQARPVDDAAAVEDIDGRRQRALRSREAVVEAMLDLIRENGEQPAAQAVADRAGVSLRTVFRHFEDVDNLFATAIAHQVQAIGGLFDPLPATGSRAERIDAIVERRRELFEHVAPIRRVARVRDDHPTIIEWLGRSHDLLRGQMTSQFQPELMALSSRQRRLLVEALDAATGFQVWDALRREQHLDAETASAVVTLTVTRLLDDVL
jgi:AcrR family transcriptional regulator